MLFKFNREQGMKKSFIYLTCAMVAGMIIVACGLPFFEVQLQQKDLESISDTVAQTMVALNQQYLPTPMSNSDLIATAVAQTVVALNQQAQASVAAAVTATPIPYQYNYYPYQYPYPSYYVQPTSAYYGCLGAIMISETYSDYSYLALNQYFNKSWRLQNVGTCSWNTGYHLALYSGNALGSSGYVNLPYTVPPGSYVDVVVPMRAPGVPGIYTGYWGLYTDSNYYIGKVWVTINAGI